MATAEANPLLAPDTARAWLLDSGRAMEADGQLILVFPVDSLTLAGLAIVVRGHPQRLPDAYASLPGRRREVGEAVLADLGGLMAERYAVPAREV